MTPKLIYGRSTGEKFLNRLIASQSFLNAVSLLNNNLSLYRDIINFPLNYFVNLTTFKRIQFNLGSKLFW